jgi:hypothetical protein
MWRLSLSDESLSDESLSDESLADESLADESLADESFPMRAVLMVRIGAKWRAAADEDRQYCFAVAL